jgi:hypothetical protein
MRIGFKNDESEKQAPSEEVKSAAEQQYIVANARAATTCCWKMKILFGFRCASMTFVIKSQDAIS